MTAIETVAVARGSAAGAGGVSFVSPFARADDAGWRYAAELDDVARQHLVEVHVDDRSVLLWREDAGEIAAYDNMCAHLGMPLAGGSVAGGVLTCPHHGFQFVLRTGECITAPEAQLTTHAVRVVGERVEVKLL